MRGCIVALAVGLLSGCSVVDWFFGDPKDRQTPDTVTFAETDAQGLLVYGLTVEGVVTPHGEFPGGIVWLVETDRDVDMVDVPFPEDLQSGDHRLVVQRALPGEWSLRNARHGEGRHAKLSDVLMQDSAASMVTSGHVTLAGEIKVQATANGVTLTYYPDTRFTRTMLKAYDGITAPQDDLPLADQRVRPTTNKKPSSH